MLRRRKDIDWSRVLPPEDAGYLQQRIDADGWYPMESFERLGLAILEQLEGATLDAVRMWGHFSAHQFAAESTSIVAQNDPLETLMRLKVQRATLFDFPALDIPMLVDGEAYVVIDYRMGRTDEEAACFQTMGFCEGMLELAGASEIRARFVERSWAGDPHTRLLLEWQFEPRSS
jgi:hypothetical protein